MVVVDLQLGEDYVHCWIYLIIQMDIFITGRLQAVAIPIMRSDKGTAQVTGRFKQGLM